MWKSILWAVASSSDQFTQLISFKIYISKSLEVTNRRRSGHRIRMATFKNSLLPEHHSLQSIVTLLANWRHMRLNKLRWKGKLPKMYLVHRTMIGSSRMRTRKWLLIEHNFLKVVYAESRLYPVPGNRSNNNYCWEKYSPWILRQQCVHFKICLYDMSICL